MILFIICKRDRTGFLAPNEQVYVIVSARGRETAKAKAAEFLAGDPDKYIVQPLTAPGAKVHFDISVQL